MLFSIFAPSVSHVDITCDIPSNFLRSFSFGIKWDVGESSRFYECVLELCGSKWDKRKTLWVKYVINSSLKFNCVMND